MMKKVLAWILVLVSLGALLLRFSDKWAEIFLGFKTGSGISIMSEPAGATVFLDNQEVGKTPFDNKQLVSKSYDVRLEKEGASWQGRVRLTLGTIIVVNRDIATDSASSAGEILTLDKGKGLTIISNPSDADIEIDGKSYGKTPVTVDIPAGDHTILVSHTSYLKRSIRANLPERYNLTVAADLALSEPDLTTSAAIPAPISPLSVIVKNTVSPNPGFLRVRDKPNLNGKEIGRAKPGDVLILLEEAGTWDKVRLSDGTEGFVSSSYVDK